MLGVDYHSRQTGWSETILKTYLRDIVRDCSPTLCCVTLTDTIQGLDPIEVKMESRSQREKRLKDHAYATRNRAFGRCLAPGDSCTNQPIHAHSVQKEGPIRLLSCNGHVVMLRQRLDSKKGPTVAFESVGINKATVFTGLCAEHDRTLFEPIDLNPGWADDPESLFLHAYRAVLRETHVCLEGVVKLQSVYMKQCDLGLVDPGVPSPAGLRAVSRMAVAYETWVYKDHIDQAFMKRDFAAFSHDLIDLGKSYPTIAVSSLFSVDEIQLANGSARIVLNVIPADGRTYAVLSYIKSDRDPARAWLAPVLAASGDRQHYLLSRLILERSDNIVISPAIYGQWSEDRREVMRKFFEATALSNDPDFEDERLNLFSADSANHE
jgi:hypothetical protein